MDPQGVLDAWPVSTRRTLRPIGTGFNNLSHLVDTPEGSYFLRVYQNTGDTTRVRYEHALLLQLQCAGLPFAVPRPLAAHGGGQIIHSDLFRGNVLMLEERVSGLLDFEFASPDLRAMDLAVGLFAFGISARETGDEWLLIEAFAAGYGRRVALNREEIGALPILVRLREATSLVHRAGRFRGGLTTEDDIVRRAEDMLGLDDWLRAHDRELIQRAEAAMR